MTGPKTGSRSPYVDQGTESLWGFAIMTLKNERIFIIIYNLEGCTHSDARII